MDDFNISTPELTDDDDSIINTTDVIENSNSSLSSNTSASALSPKTPSSEGDNDDSFMANIQKSSKRMVATNRRRFLDETHDDNSITNTTDDVIENSNSSISSNGSDSVFEGEGTVSNSSRFVDEMHTPRPVKAVIPSRSPSPSSASGDDGSDVGDDDVCVDDTLLHPIRHDVSVSSPDSRHIVNSTARASSSAEMLTSSRRDKLHVVEDVSNAQETPGDDDDINDIIDISSDDDVFHSNSIVDTTTSTKLLDLTNLRQTTLDETMLLNKTKNQVVGIEVSPQQYQQQKIRVQDLRMQLQKAKNTMLTVNLNHLPDNGRLLITKEKSLRELLLKEEQLFGKMQVNNSKVNIPVAVPAPKNLITWDAIQQGAGAVQPRTFGKQAMATYNAQKMVTMDRLEQLHGSLKSCPSETEIESDPKGLKIKLMQHQSQALAWLLWRERQKPSGGILADDMGLGKTLTMISLILKARELHDAKEDGDSSDNDDEENRVDRKKAKYSGGTLVVCPASLLNQWESEVKNRCKRGLLSVELYHGAKRETKPKLLSQHDIVISTYTIILNECERNGAAFRIRWNRIILDEAHQIRNHKAQSSIAVCRLSGKFRWILTGTPIHNKAMDMFALFKFLRCSPFDDISVWKRWVGDKSSGGQERLHTVISSLMLRRTKPELIERGILGCMTERNWEIVEIKLQKNELGVYQKIMIFSRTIFAQFLHQRAQKNQDMIDDVPFNSGIPNDPNSEYFKMRQKLLKLHKVQDIKQHEILVLLLRLRQICCHPHLITKMLEGTEDLNRDEDEDEHTDELSLLEQLNKLDLNDDDNQIGANDAVAGGDFNGATAGISTHEGVGLTEASKSLLNPSNPVFSKDYQSSKIKATLNLLNEKILGTDDKAIIVSQWTSFLHLVAIHLKNGDIPFLQLDGTIPVNKRMPIIDDFNNSKHRARVLLLSLTAGGVGLNLTGANHLILLDLHWNPQLENQAQDRIYRMGQTKAVHVYKLMACETVEERIKNMQETKMNLAESMLTGSKQVIQSKLTLNDLKMLFTA